MAKHHNLLPRISLERFTLVVHKRFGFLYDIQTSNIDLCEISLINADCRRHGAFSNQLEYFIRDKVPCPGCFKEGLTVPDMELPEITIGGIRDRDFSSLEGVVRTSLKTRP